MQMATFWRLLKANARTKAELKGHENLPPFTATGQWKKLPWRASSRCPRCRMEVYVQTKEPYMHGPALQLPCARPTVVVPLQTAIQDMMAGGKRNPE